MAAKKQKKAKPRAKGRRRIRRYSPEFRDNAVKLARPQRDGSFGGSAM